MSSNWNRLYKLQPIAIIRLVRYLFVGGTAALVDFVFFAALVTALGVAWYYAAIVSFTVATLTNYFLSIRFVFHSGVRFGRKHEVALIFLVSAIALAVNQMALYALIAFAGINPLIAKLGATAAVFLWDYSVRLKFIFRKI